MATSDGLFFTEEDDFYSALLPVVEGWGTEHGGQIDIEVPLIQLDIRTGGLAEFGVPKSIIASTGDAHDLGIAAISVPIVTLETKTGGVMQLTPPVPTLNAVGRQDNLGTAKVSVPVITLVADGKSPVIGKASVNVPLILLSADGSFINQGNADITVPRVDIDVSGLMGTIGGGTLTVPILQLEATGTFAPNGSALITVPLLILEARASGAIVITSEVGESESETFAVSMNLTNRAVSEYLNYKFNSQTYFGGKYIGANENGIYDLTGDDDAGTDIVARIRTGLDSLGSYNLKRVWGVYLTHNGEALRVKTASPADTYDTIAGAKNRSSISVQKFRSQRTKRDNYWGIEISNVGGSDFEINGLEIVCEVLNRRAL
jgi:hypothetical protein